MGILPALLLTAALGTPPEPAPPEHLESALRTVMQSPIKETKECTKYSTFTLVHPYEGGGVQGDMLFHTLLYDCGERAESPAELGEEDFFGMVATNTIPGRIIKTYTINDAGANGIDKWDSIVASQHNSNVNGGATIRMLRDYPDVHTIYEDLLDYLENTPSQEQEDKENKPKDTV